METIQIPVSTATLDRIQKYSTRPLLETPDMVLNRILDLIENKHPPGKLVAVTEGAATAVYTTSRGVHLPIGLDLWATYRGTTPRALVTAEGIKYKGKIFDDPSAAAKAAKEDAGATGTTTSTNGWVFWMVKPSQSPTGKNASIDVFRRVS